MRYLATQVRIFTGTNSRGEYHYMSMRLFNDKNPAANPTRLPTHYIMQELIVNAFLECKDALTNNEGGWIDVDMSKVPDTGLTAHHLDDVNREIVNLDGWYQQCYTRDYTDANGVFHAKGTLRMGRNGQPLPPVNAIPVTVQYFQDDTFENGQKVTRWMPVETKEQIAQGILERGYIKVGGNTVDTSMADTPEEIPDEDDKEAKRKALEEQLAALK
jgi:hypothetical protein